MIKPIEKSMWLVFQLGIPIGNEISPLNANLSKPYSVWIGEDAFPITFTDISLVVQFPRKYISIPFL